MKAIPMPEKPIRCPICGKVYRGPVAPSVWLKAINYTFDYPKQECLECIALASAIKRGGPTSPTSPGDDQEGA